MSTGVIVAIAAVVVIVVALAAFLRQTSRRHPENTAGHERAGQPAQPDAGPVGTQPYPGVDRPAGPGAEGQAVSGPGDVAPGPPTR
jgi:hypothetical protein